MLFNRMLEALIRSALRWLSTTSFMEIGKQMVTNSEFSLTADLQSLTPIYDAGTPTF